MNSLLNVACQLKNSDYETYQLVHKPVDSRGMLGLRGHWAISKNPYSTPHCYELSWPELLSIVFRRLVLELKKKNKQG